MTTKLSEVYDLIEGLKRRDLPVPEALQQEASELELALFREELATAVNDHIQPLLDRVKSNWVLVLHHQPASSVNMVATHEEAVLSLLDDAVGILTAQPRPLETSTSPATETATTSTRSQVEAGTPIVAAKQSSQSIGFAVYFADGTVIDEVDASKTLVNSLRHMGFEQASHFTTIRFAKGAYPLVSRKQRTDRGKDGKVVKWQEPVENGWYVYLNMSNEMKKRILQLTATYLGIQLKIQDHNVNGLKFSGKKEKGHRALFSLNGREPLDKRNSVLAAVKLYKANHPNATYAEMRRTFPATLQGSYGVVCSLEEIEERRRQGKDVDGRYFLDPHQIMTSADGVQFAVSNQWGDQFYRFQEHLRTLGWTLIEETLSD